MFELLLILSIVISVMMLRKSQQEKHQIALTQIRALQEENEILKIRMAALETVAVLVQADIKDSTCGNEDSTTSKEIKSTGAALSSSLASAQPVPQHRPLIENGDHPVTRNSDHHLPTATSSLTSPEKEDASHHADDNSRPVVMSVAAEASRPEPDTSFPDLESRIGGRWAVWIGGIILAIGGLFLVRYSYETGILGPKVRLSGALVLSVTLAIAAEFLRRQDGTLFPKMPPAQAAHIPSITMAASATIFLGTVYAAHTVYGLIGQTLAFALMGLAGMGALALAMIMGRVLIVVGLLGSYLTPVLVGGSAESFYPLSLFLTSVTAFALLIYARLATSVSDDWIAWCIAFGMTCWSGLMSTPVIDDHASLVLITAGSALWAATMMLGRAGAIKRRGWQALVLWLPGFILAAVLGFRFATTPTGLLPVAAVGLVMVAIAMAQASLDWRTTWTAQTATLLPVGIILVWGQKPRLSVQHMGSLSLIDALTNDVWLPSPSTVIFGLVTFLLALTVPFLVQWSNYAIALPAQPRWRRAWAETSTYAFVTARSPVMIAAALAFIIVGLHHSWWAGAGFVILAGILAAGAEMLFRRTPEVWPDTRQQESFYLSSNAYAAAASLAFGIAVAYALPAMWMAVGFAIACALVAALNTCRPLYKLRHYAVFFALLAVVRTLIVLPLDDLGSWPVLNGLLIAYGIPALAFAGAGWFLRKDRQDGDSTVVEVMALAFAACLLAFSVRHAFHGSVSWQPLSFHETWVFGLVAIGCFAATWQLYIKTSGSHFRVAAEITLTLFAVLLIVGLGLVFNPLVTGEAGPETMLINRLSVSALSMSAAALVPSILLWRGKYAFLAKVFAFCAGFGLILFVVQQVRIGFHGSSMLDGGRIGLGEAGLYTLIALCVAVVSHLARHRLGPRATDIAALANLLACGFIIVMGGIWANPVTHDGLFGWPVLDSGLVGYFLPACMFIWLAYHMQPTAEWHPTPRMNHGIGLFFAYLYILLQVRRAFAGPQLAGEIGEIELYAYSLTTLTYGVLLLAWGMLGQQRFIRVASGVAITAAICKAFLFDMSSLQGVLRALSFIGLGLALIAIGLFYQRFLRKPA